MRLSRSYPRIILTICVLFLSELNLAADLQLPDLGDASTGLVTPRQEYELGQKWLRLYRSKVPTSSDPFLQSYTEDLVRKLSYYSDLDDKRLNVLVVENAALNAFAVPGGIIGVHTGLFEYATTEDQFASVMAHELAHLSQRHYARRVADQKDKALGTMAGLLASILIAATAGGDAGIAAISATQAAALESQLRFSRQMEQEADRIGMETMVRAGKNPTAMGDMFENMLKSQRYSRRPPEFLLTHPLTESRVSDAKLRALKFDQKFHKENLEYQFARVRAVLANENNIQFAIRRLENEREGNKYPQEVSTYGLAVALTRANKTEEAKKVLQPLLDAAPENLYYVIAMAEIEAEEQNFDKAVARLEKQVKRFPKHHALNIRFAEILMKASKYEACQNLLLAHSKRRPKDDYVWYLLAEVHGLVGNIFAVHTSRAEYFLLNGLYDKAIIQLENAQKMVKKDKFLLARVEQRLKYAIKLKEEDRL